MNKLILIKMKIPKLMKYCKIVKFQTTMMKYRKIIFQL